MFDTLASMLPATNPLTPGIVSWLTGIAVVCPFLWLALSSLRDKR